MPKRIHPESASPRRSGAILAVLLLCANSGRVSMLGRWGGFWNLPDVPSLPGTRDGAPATLICPCANVLTPNPAVSRLSVCLPDTPTGLSYDLALAPFTVPVIFFQSWDARRSTCSFWSHWRRTRRVRSSTGISWALPAPPEVACPDRKHRPVSPLPDDLDRNDAAGTSGRKHSVTCLDLDFRTTEVIALTNERPPGFLYSRGLSGSMRPFKRLMI